MQQRSLLSGVDTAIVEAHKASMAPVTPTHVGLTTLQQMRPNMYGESTMDVFATMTLSKHFGTRSTT